MALAMQGLKWDRTTRRFLLWMAIGTAFILALIGTDYFGAIPIP
jgi:hypothetical protein